MKTKLFVVLSLIFSFSLLKTEIKAQANPSVPLNSRVETKIPADPCAKRVLEVNFKITNVSNQDIVIDRNSDRYSHSLMYIDFALGSGGGEYSTSRSGSSGGGGYAASYLKLKPKKSYSIKRIVEDTELFKIDRDVKFFAGVTYEQPLESSFEGMKVWKGTVRSNSMKFKFKPCQDKKAAQF